MKLSDLVGSNDKNCLVVIGNLANVDDEVIKQNEKIGLSNAISGGVGIFDGDNNGDVILDDNNGILISATQ